MSLSTQSSLNLHIEAMSYYFPGCPESVTDTLVQIGWNGNVTDQDAYHWT